MLNSAFGIMAEFPFAQGAAAPSLLPPWQMLALLALVFYLVVMRPEQQKQKARQLSLSGVKKNDHIITVGGIYGVVMNVQRETNEVTIKVDESTNTKLRITLGSIERVVSAESSEEKSGK